MPRSTIHSPQHLPLHPKTTRLRLRAPHLPPLHLPLLLILLLPIQLPLLVALLRLVKAQVPTARTHLRMVRRHSLLVKVAQTLRPLEALKGRKVKEMMSSRALPSW